MRDRFLALVGALVAVIGLGLAPLWAQVVYRGSPQAPPAPGGAVSPKAPRAPTATPGATKWTQAKTPWGDPDL